jgi:hypothetical protein
MDYCSMRRRSANIWVFLSCFEAGIMSSGQTVGERRLGRYIRRRVLEPKRLGHSPADLIVDNCLFQRDTVSSHGHFTVRSRIITISKGVEDDDLEFVIYIVRVEMFHLVRRTTMWNSPSRGFVVPPASHRHHQATYLAR